LGTDIRGSGRGITDGYGVMEGRYEYDIFGVPYEGETNNGMGLGYTGKPYNPVTGLYNYGYRDYAPEVARFTSEDPVRDGANWFAYVNNDPVNWVDLWGLNASDKSEFSETIIDTVGKVWAAPMTALGFVAGAVLTGASILTGNGGHILLENNAITFTTGLNLGGSITLGNTIIHAGPVIEGKPWNSEKDVPRYDGTVDVNSGKHEEAHTYQYQALGVFTIPAIISSAIANGGIGAGDGSFHDFMAQSAYEKAADDYAQFGTSPIPSIP
jgi:RHS repeat-associated protein